VTGGHKNDVECHFSDNNLLRHFHIMLYYIPPSVRPYVL